MSREKQFNFLNFFYGVGATIILVAAMFKFLGWQNANEVFIVGIIVEAVVFFISAFDWSTGEKEYDWEKVFPQLNENNEHLTSTNLPLAEGTQQQQVQKIMETVTTLSNSVNELNNATQKLTKSVEMMEKNYDIVSESTLKYQVQIDSLRTKVAAANENLKDFDKFNLNK
ncbi:MAG: hypothetical protein COA58_06855 [Bacteroidetes bacterium]|nr:MAG: hypothetical protein COA58_06855 [Bacteroidota bacterium]